MQADLSRLIFRPDKRFSAVVAQGRLQLDSDSNEQVFIQLHQARTLAADLISRRGGPAGSLGFGITRTQRKGARRPDHHRRALLRRRDPGRRGPAGVSGPG